MRIVDCLQKQNYLLFLPDRGESEIQDTIGDCVRILSGEMRASSVKVFLYVFVRSVPARHRLGSSVCVKPFLF